MKTGEQLADILTKGVSSSVLYSALCKLGMRNIFAFAWGVVLEDENLRYAVLFTMIWFPDLIPIISYLDRNFLQTGLKEITSNPYKIVISVYKHLKGTLNS